MGHSPPKGEGKSVPNVSIGTDFEKTGTHVPISNLMILWDFQKFRKRPRDTARDRDNVSQNGPNF